MCDKGMKVFIPVMFVIMGIILLLTSTLFFNPLANLLLDIQQEAGLFNPSSWDLPMVLRFVRVVFIVAGVFLASFGAGLVWFEKAKGCSPFEL